MHVRKISAVLLLGVATVAAAGCGNSGGGAGLTTASLLDGAPASNEDGISTRKDDPLARPTQVAWTAARAQRCGFNFDAATMKRNYLAYEASQGAAQPQLATLEKAYDQSFAVVTKTAQTPNYCTDKKAQAIKADLTRHLGGDYAPRVLEVKPQPTGGMFDGLASNTPDKFNPGTFWQDQEDKKNGVRRAE